MSDVILANRYPHKVKCGNSTEKNKNRYKSMKSKTKKAVLEAMN